MTSIDPPTGMQLRQHRAHLARQARLSPAPLPSKPVAPRPISPFDPRRFAAASPQPRRGALFSAPIIECGDGWRDIAAEVAAAHGFTLRELCSARREHALVVARHEAMWRCHRELGMTLSAIGRRFGDRDHSTVHNALKAHVARQRAKAEQTP